MSVLGIDFGNESSYVAVARNGGIETVYNDYSLRATPSFVGFGERQRILGVAAKSQAVTNAKNTIFNFKRFLGRQFDDPMIQEDIKRVPFKTVKTQSGGVGIQAAYLGEEHIFTPEQVAGMMFTKLKETTENALNHTKVHDCVISVPSYFTDAERRALLDASQIAGLNVIRLLNETAAAALSYGFYRQDLPASEEKPRNVVIVDCGNSAIQVSVCAFNNGNVKILASTADPYLGGRNFDAALASHFSHEFRTKYGIDPESNPRAYMRLLTELDKLKKQMSANATKLPLNIECLLEDKDVTSSMCRSDFESICAPLFNRVELVLQQCLNDSKVEVQNIHSVEIIGGSTRIPAIKYLIEKVFHKPPSTTLNQDEAVAKGCALLCAILSPNFKVRDFSITDVQSYPITLVWDETLGEDGSSEVFPRYHPVPFSRMLTFVRKEPLVLQAVYSDLVPFLTNRIGTFVINFKNGLTEPCKLKIKAKINRHRIFSVYSATIYDLVEEAEVVPAVEPMDASVITPTSESDKMSQEPVADSQSSQSSVNAYGSKESVETDNTDAVNEDVNMEDLDGEGIVKKITLKARVLLVAAETFGMSKAELDEKIMSEVHMVNRDRNEKERLDSKNTLEEYVYDLRQKLESELEMFVQSSERQHFLDTMHALENWLYEEGSEEKKEVYITKLQELKRQGEPIKERRLEAMERPKVFKNFEAGILMCRKFVDLYEAKDPRCEHIPSTEIEKLVNAINEGQQWLENCRQKFHQSKFQLHMPVPVKVIDVVNQLRLLESKVTPVMNMPKPKTETVKKKVDEASPPPSPEIVMDDSEEEPLSQRGMDVE